MGKSRITIALIRIISLDTMCNRESKIAYLRLYFANKMLMERDQEFIEQMRQFMPGENLIVSYHFGMLKMPD